MKLHFIQPDWWSPQETVNHCSHMMCLEAAEGVGDLFVSCQAVGSRWHNALQKTACVEEGVNMKPKAIKMVAE